MTPSPDQNDRLERLIHRTLRDMPPRRAPGTIEQRVLAEIARLAALPWWRKSFVHWPVPARAGFIVLLAGVIKLVLIGAVWIMAGFDAAQFREAFATQFTWIEAAFAVMRAVGDFFEIIGRNIPPLWVYAGLAFIAAMYSALFGLGAAAYRTLLARHQIP